MFSKRRRTTDHTPHSRQKTVVQHILCKRGCRSGVQSAAVGSFSEKATSIYALYKPEYWDSVPNWYQLGRARLNK